MKIALIDDNSTVLAITEVMMVKEKIALPNTIAKFKSIIDIDYVEFSSQYDVVICDMDLGNDSPNGLDFLKKIKSSNSSVVCILLTGDDSVVMRTKMALHSDIHYVIKNNAKENGTIAQIGNILEGLK